MLKTFWRTFNSSCTASVDRDRISCSSFTLWFCFRHEWHSSCSSSCITLYLMLCILLPLNPSSRTFICTIFHFLHTNLVIFKVLIFLLCSVLIIAVLHSLIQDYKNTLQLLAGLPYPQGSSKGTVLSSGLSVEQQTLYMTYISSD